jgi:hypothetical protein
MDRHRAAALAGLLPRLAVAGLVPALTAAPAHAARAQASVSGTATDAATGRPVADVAVRIAGAGLQTVTDASGRFRFAAIPAGRHVLQSSHIAFASRSDTLDLADDLHLDIGVRLAGAALPLEPLQVAARSRTLIDAGFYQRRDRGIGEYITRNEIRDRGHQRLSDLLATIPGFRRTLRADGTSSMDARGKKSIVLTCDTQYFLDGLRADIAATDIDNLGLEDVEAVEVYRGAAGIPLQYGAVGGACGAVLIWMRKR